MDTCKIVVVVLVKDDLRDQKLNYQAFANQKMEKNQNGQQEGKHFTGG